MPTMSARRKVPVRGQPMACPVSASTSSMVSFCSSISAAAENMTRDADAVGDEIGGVVGEYHELAQIAVGEGGKGGQHCRIGFGGGNDLEEAHVARRIEKMSSEESGCDARRAPAAICLRGKPEVLVVSRA